MDHFKDLFSVQARDYAKYRPTYPAGLFQYLASITPIKKLAWDAGTGNGQAAVELAKFFEKVNATDPSEKQIKEATQKDNITYLVEKAERASLSDHSVDLITVAQAFHWLKHAEFAEVCKRVAAPDCHLAVWSYSLCMISIDVDRAVEKLYKDVLGPYWEKERHHVEEGYKNIVMPFQEINTPGLSMEAVWSLEQFLGYLKTWSALQTYLKTNPPALINDAFNEISMAWGDNKFKDITWPLNLRVWKI